MATNLAKLLIKAADGRYLILRSSEWPENPKRSLQPDLPGGVVEEGETAEIGAVRELLEEAAITIKPEQLKLAYSAPETHDGRKYHRYIFFVTLPNVPEVTLSWEHDKFWWMTAEEVLSIEIREPFPTILKYMSDAGLLV